MAWSPTWLGNRGPLHRALPWPVLRVHAQILEILGSIGEPEDTMYADRDLGLGPRGTA